MSNFERLVRNITIMSVVGTPNQRASAKRVLARMLGTQMAALILSRGLPPPPPMSRANRMARNKAAQTLRNMKRRRINPE